MAVEWKQLCHFGHKSESLIIFVYEVITFKTNTQYNAGGAKFPAGISSIVSVFHHLWVKYLNFI